MIVHELKLEIGKLREVVSSVKSELNLEKEKCDKVTKDLTALRSTRVYKSGVYFDVDQMCKGQKSYDKSGIGYKNKSIFFGIQVSGRPKQKLEASSKYG